LLFLSLLIALRSGDEDADEKQRTEGVTGAPAATAEAMDGPSRPPPEGKDV
jgi:hypothetical protein